jgi:predicted acyl esterase
VAVTILDDRIAIRGCRSVLLPIGPMRRLRSVCTTAKIVILFCGCSLLAQPARRDIRIPAADGVKLAATYYTPERPGPSILFFHQCSRDHTVWDHLATGLANSGFHVLIVAPRGIGKSEGEQWDYDGNLDHALEYWGIKWSSDAETSYQWLLSQAGVNQRIVGVAGAGCGAFLALLTAQKHYPTTKTLVLLSGFENQSTSAFVEHADHLSILSAASTKDSMSISAVEKLKRLSKNPDSRLISYPEQGHGIGLIEAHPELESIVLHWFQTQLR